MYMCVLNTLMFEGKTLSCFRVTLIKALFGVFHTHQQVRYYVREYGGESTSEAESVRVYKKTPRVKTLVLEDPTEV